MAFTLNVARSPDDLVFLLNCRNLTHLHILWIVERGRTMARFLGLRGARLTSAISAICGLCFLYVWALPRGQTCVDCLTGAMAMLKVSWAVY
jgi:hypothetical protein